jgi:hypothetical protein
MDEIGYLHTSGHSTATNIPGVFRVRRRTGFSLPAGGNRSGTASRMSAAERFSIIAGCDAQR